MSHAQHWPALTPSTSRFKVFLAVFATVAGLSLASYYWRVTAHNALLQTASLPTAASPHAKIVPPAVLSSNIVSRDDRQNREAEFLVFMGDEMFHRGDVVGAAQAFHDALGQNPTSEVIHLKLALCYMRLNRADDALALLNEAIHIAPDFAEAHHQMGLVLMSKGKFADAAEHLLELTRRKPQQASAFNGLGLALARQGKLAYAATNFSTAIRLNPSYVEARFNLAQVYLQLGAPVQAAVELDHALKINPRFHAARAAREQLGNLRTVRPAPRTNATL